MFFLVLKTKSVPGTFEIDADSFNIIFCLVSFIFNKQVLFYLLQNALEFSQIFLNPLAVVLTAVLKPHGSYRLLF